MHEQDDMQCSCTQVRQHRCVRHMQLSDFDSPDSLEPAASLCSVWFACSTCVFCYVCVHFCVCILYVCVCVCFAVIEQRILLYNRPVALTSPPQARCVLHVFSCMLVCAVHKCVFSRSLFIRGDLSWSSVCLCPRGVQRSPRARLTLGLLLFVRPHLSFSPLAMIHQSPAAANANPSTDSSFKQLDQCCHEGNIFNLIPIQKKDCYEPKDQKWNVKYRLLYNKENISNESACFTWT